MIWLEVLFGVLGCVGLGLAMTSTNWFWAAGLSAFAFACAGGVGYLIGAANG